MKDEQSVVLEQPTATDTHDEKQDKKSTDLSEVRAQLEDDQPLSDKFDLIMQSLLDPGTSAKPTDNGERPDQHLVPSQTPSELLNGLAHLKVVNWREKIEDPLLKPRNLSDLVVLYQCAEKAGQVDKKEIGEAVSSMFQKEFSKNLSTKKYYEGLEGEQYKRVSEYYQGLLTGLRAEINRSFDDSEYAYNWYKRAVQAIEKAREELLAGVGDVNTQLKDLLGQYKQTPWVDMTGKVTIVSAPEYEELMVAKYGRGDFAIENSRSNGYVTDIKPGEPRAIVLKLGSPQMQLVNTNAPKEGIKSHLFPGQARQTLVHEGIHLVTDGRPVDIIDTPQGRRVIDKRGFKTQKFDEDGISVYEPDDLPQLAMDEGAVTFLQKYVQYGQEMTKVRASFNNPMAGFGLSDDYIKAAAITTELVDQIGFENFAWTYINSNPEEWIRYISSYLDPQKRDEYIEGMKILQNKMIGIE